MQGWHGAFLGRRRLPRALSGFELEAFLIFTGAEGRAIEQRRTSALRLGLALHVGFLRMSGGSLAAVGCALGLLANLVMAWNTAQMQPQVRQLSVPVRARDGEAGTEKIQVVRAILRSLQRNVSLRLSHGRTPWNRLPYHSITLFGARAVFFAKTSAITIASESMR
jgi:hypothetical protein